MKRNWIKFAGAAVLAAGMVFAQTSSTAPAPQGNGTAHVNRRAAARHRMMQALNLTESQKQQAKTIFEQARKSAQPVVQELMQNREALAAAVKADDTAGIQQLAAKQGQLRGQMLSAHAEAMAKFYQTLTPAQKAKAEQIRQTVRARMMHRNG